MLSAIRPFVADARGGSNAYRLLFAIVVVLGVFFRLYNIDRKPYWEDEMAGGAHALGYTLKQIDVAAPHMHTAGDVQRFFHFDRDESLPTHLKNTVLSLALEDPQHPPAYYILSSMWMELFGSSVAAIRTLPAIIGILAIALTYWLSVELFGSRLAASLATMLVAVSPFHVLYSQEAREYSLWTLQTLVSGLALLRALRVRSATSWIGYGLVTALGLFVFPFSGFVAIGQGAYVYFFGERSRGRAWFWYCGCMTVASLAFAPWFATMFRGDTVARGLGGILTAKVSSARIAVEFARHIRESFVDLGLFKLGSVSSTPVNAVLGLAVLVLVAISIIWLVGRGPSRVGAFVMLTLCCPLVPLVLHDLIVGGRVVDQSRYFVPLYLGFELAVAAFVYANVSFEARMNRCRLGTLAAYASLVALGVISCSIGARADTWWNKDYEDSRNVANVVNSSRLPIVIAECHSSHMWALGYYLKPTVSLRVNVRCDRNEVALPPRIPLLRSVDRYHTVFLLGPSASILSEVVDARRSAKSISFKNIDVRIYTRTVAPLALFRPI